MKKPKNYINNKDLYNALVEYQKDNNPKSKAANYISEAIMLMSNKIANKPNFIGYSYRDEMIIDGAYDCMLYGVKNFNPQYENPFAYFTQIIHQAFIRKIKTEKLNQYIKYKILQGYETEEELISTNSIPENINEFIRDFEQKLEEKKIKNTKLTGIETFFEENVKENPDESKK